MEICIFGKYPPIEGGVSMRTYWLAHGLARLGHTVHVITNAKEVGLPYRMFMRQEDWARCEGHYGDGSVKVHWTESYGQQEWHIPSNTPFVTKLASLGLELTLSRPIDVLYAHYLEPYGVAAHIVAQAAGVPLVMRPAGSDAGRLWSLPQFRALYNHIFTSAAAVVCGPTVARRVIEAGVDPTRVARDPERHMNLSELFAPAGAALDVALLRDEIESDDRFRSALFGEFDPSLNYFGIYGKLGKAKGTHSLLAAFKKMHDRGLPVGLLVMAHGRPAARDPFREYVKSNGLEKRVFQLPFLPHWRVPEFIRRCTAICCLEQDFPIKFHDPVPAREALACGACLVGSSEIIRKLPERPALTDGHNCIVAHDVNDIDQLERQLISILESPARADQMRLRAREYAVEIDKGKTFPRWLESTLIRVAQREGRPVDGGGDVLALASALSLSKS
jgi:glycosyltransferase involved in cell wall biosynthesis